MGVFESAGRDLGVVCFNRSTRVSRKQIQIERIIFKLTWQPEHWTRKPKCITGESSTCWSIDGAGSIVGRGMRLWIRTGNGLTNKSSRTRHKYGGHDAFKEGCCFMFHSIFCGYLLIFLNAFCSSLHPYRYFHIEHNLKIAIIYVRILVIIAPYH